MKPQPKQPQQKRLSQMIRLLSGGLLGAALAVPAAAMDKPEEFVFVTNWYAQAEHGGFYQAVAEGLYEQAGLDVTIKMGGPQVNIVQLMAAGKADCIMGSSDLQMMIARANGVPLVTVASAFQKDPQVLIAHADVRTMEDMADKTILISSAAHQGYWPWAKGKYGFTDSQSRPYTYNIQPFLARADFVQQGYLTSEPFAIASAGIEANTFLLADHGYPAYSSTTTCMEQTVESRPEALKAFVEATAAGWESYLADPSAGNVLIKKDNPKMTDEQLAYSLSKLKEMQIVTGGDAQTLGVNVITETRARSNYDFLVDNGLISADAFEWQTAFDFSFIGQKK